MQQRQASKQTNKLAHTGSSKRTKQTDKRTHRRVARQRDVDGRPRVGVPDLPRPTKCRRGSFQQKFWAEGLLGTAGTARYSRHLGEQTCGGEAEGSETETALRYQRVLLRAPTSANMRCSLRNACSFVAASIHSAVARECSNAARTWAARVASQFRFRFQWSGVQGTFMAVGYSRAP